MSPEQAVAHGSGAVAPTVPNKSDVEYFWRWDASFDNVTGPMTIHALYHSPVEVTFLGKDDEVVEVKKVAYEGSCVPPTEPSYQDWVFDRWDGNFVGVVQNSVVKGVYKAPVTVTFRNGDGSAMKTLTVPYGGAAVPPQDDPTKSASVFIGWAEDFSHVTEDLEVHPAFDVKFYVTFMDFNGEVIETNVVDYGATAMLSAENEGRLGDITDENGSVNKWTGRWADINAPEVVYDITSVQRDLILVPIY